MFSLARDLHMTVQTLMESMTQKELCYWMAFHRIEKEENEERRNGGRSERRQRPTGTRSDTDVSKDETMLSQLLMMAGKKRRR